MGIKSIKMTSYLLVYSTTSSAISASVETRPRWLEITEATEISQQVQGFHLRSYPAADGSTLL